jgi:hypothetical protein
MRVIREIKLDGQAICQVKELTVGDIRFWLASKTAPGDLIDSELFDEISISDIPVMTSLSAEQVEAMSPSEIDAILPVIREVNARFFTMREKVVNIGHQILANQQKSESAPLSGA